MSRKKHLFIISITLLCMISMLFVSNVTTRNIYAASGYSFVILSDYAKTLHIGDEFYLLAVTSSGAAPSFSSSSSSIASVNSYGKITAKKAGKTTITAKIKGGEASCKITVSPTVITLGQTSLSLQNGYSKKLTARVSTGHEITWKSSRTSIASVDSTGTVTAKKPGSTTITATADKTSVICKVTVKAPTVTLSRTSVSLYRTQRQKLTVSSTSRSLPKWKSSKKSVVTVDSSGNLTALRHGTAIITVTVDNVSKTCEVTVKKPVISFSPSQITLTAGQIYTPSVSVSSGNRPEYKSSNSNIASVDANGRVTARQTGKAYIYASEDGTKESLIVTVR